MKYHVVIPTIGRSPFLPALLDVLLADADCLQVELPDNGPEPEHALKRYLFGTDEGLHIYTGLTAGRLLAFKANRSIYDSWNEAIRRAQGEGVPCVCLNDDIRIDPLSIPAALTFAGVHDTGLIGLDWQRSIADGVGVYGWRAVTGTFRVGGIGGHAFVVTAHNPARVDQPFQWWYGDDWLVRRTLEAGLKCGVALGTPVEHPRPSLSGNQMPWVAEACQADRALWESLTGLPG